MDFRYLKHVEGLNPCQKKKKLTSNELSDNELFPILSVGIEPMYFMKIDSNQLLISFSNWQNTLCMSWHSPDSKTDTKILPKNLQNPS